MLLVPKAPFFEGGDLGARKLKKVQLVTITAKASDVDAVFRGTLLFGLLVRNAGYVVRKGAKGVNEIRSLLDGKPLSDVGAIARPDEREIIEHPEIESRPAGSAALEQDPGVACPDARKRFMSHLT